MSSVVESSARHWMYRCEGVDNAMPVLEMFSHDDQLILSAEVWIEKLIPVPTWMVEEVNSGPIVTGYPT